MSDADDSDNSPAFIQVDGMPPLSREAFHEDADRSVAECAARGAHLPSGPAGKDGWVICDHCSIPLQPPDGGPLGPDTRGNGS
jgi:hypothetical protein